LLVDARGKLGRVDLVSADLSSLLVENGQAYHLRPSDTFSGGTLLGEPLDRRYCNR